MGQQARESYENRQEERLEGPGSKLRGNGIGFKRQSPRGMEVIWQEGILQASCCRTETDLVSRK